MNDYTEEIHESKQVFNSTKTLRLVLDAKYDKGRFRCGRENQCQHLDKTQCNELLKLLPKFEAFFDGALGTWKTYLVDLELKGDTNPIFSVTYPLPKAYEEMLKKIEHLFLLGVIEKSNDSEWGAPSFAKP